MARERLSAVANEINGATSPGHIHRVKRFRDARGKIIGLGVQETFEVMHPRDWKRKPAKGAEKENHQLFKKAAAIADKALNTEEGLTYWQKRFEAQLPTTRGAKPDPFALLLPNGTKKRYIRFDAFVSTMIMQELKAKKA